jgi:hypothetical protein
MPLEKDTFRPVVCPWCKRLGYVPITLDDGTLELSGCVPCGGSWCEFGHGVIAVRFVEDEPCRR